MKKVVEQTHTCTRCSNILVYTNVVSWYNARKRKERQGFLFCRKCKDAHASEVNKGNPKITGRPKGSKTCPERLINHRRQGAGHRLNSTVTSDQRMKGIAKRNGFNSYEEYRNSLPEWKKYRVDVLRITKQQPLHLLENYDKRGVNGVPGTYTLDHIVSIRKGFNENIPPDQIGHISNLQMLPWEDNITKGWK
jgi:transcription elongation factor Elf1